MANLEYATPKKIVTRQQGVLGGLSQDIERIHQINRDHVLMCKSFKEEPATGVGPDADTAIEMQDMGADSFSVVAQLIEEAVTTSRKAAGEHLDLQHIYPDRKR